MADVIGIAGPDRFGLVEFFELIVLFLDLLLLLLLLLLLVLILVLVPLIRINILQFGLVFVFLSFLQVEDTNPL